MHLEGQRGCALADCLSTHVAHQQPSTPRPKGCQLTWIPGPSLMQDLGDKQKCIAV